MEFSISVSILFLRYLLNTMKRPAYILVFLCATLFTFFCGIAQENASTVGLGWANNSVNTVIFRKNAITSFKEYQFTAYYDANQNLILAKRKLDSGSWQTQKTPYKGNATDAHNAISLAIDGNGYLHVSWDHHNSSLCYAMSKEPLGLKLSEEKSMTGDREDRITYPQFLNLKNGDLLFMYRDGKSGMGSLVINRFDNTIGKWEQLHKNLIDGEGERNAYWQTCVDKAGNIHISWVWRETWDVSTNHDLCYALSKDGGYTWERSTGEKYTLPISIKSAEYAWKIPRKSSLINQTSMTTDKDNNPIIASYWNEGGSTQYQIVFIENDQWKKINTGFRKSGFELGGGGTKKIPISRPEILSSPKNGKTLHLLFRDGERGNKISLAHCTYPYNSPWKVEDITSFSVGEWEPNYDLELFSKEGKLHIFTQNVTQKDGEGLANIKPTPIKIIEIKKLPHSK